MATVIDKLVVELGLDPSKFNQGQVAAVEAFKKTQTQAVKSAKAIETSSTSAADAIIKVSRATLGLLGVFLSARGAIEFTTKITGLNAELGRLARNLQQSPQLISALGMAAERVGGDAAATKQTIAGWAQALFDFRFNGKDLPEVLFRLQAISRININKTDAVKSMYDIADAMKALADQGKRQDAFFIGKELGFDEGTINLLMQGAAALKAVVEQTEKLAPSNKAITDAQELQKAWASMEQSATKFGTELVDTIVPATVSFANATKAALDYMILQKQTQQDMIDKATKSVADGTYDPSQTGGRDVRGSGFFPWLAKIFGGGNGGGTSAADAQAQRKRLWGQSRGIEFGDDGGASGKEISLLHAGDDDQRKKLEVNGTEVTQGNPLPVRVVSDQSFESKGFLQSIADWFGGGSGGGTRNVDLNGGDTSSPRPGRGRTKLMGSGGRYDGAHVGDGPAAHASKNQNINPENAAAIRAAAKELGTTPEDLATVMGYETIGTYSPKIYGGADGKYMGLIQFGPHERQQYGANDRQSFPEQMHAVVRYLKSRGFKPGMGIEDLYSTINAGSPGQPNASDGNGTVRSHVARMIKERAAMARYFAHLGETTQSVGSRAFGVSGAQAASLSTVANDNRTSRTNSNTNNLSIGHISVNADGAGSAKEIAGHIAPELARDWFSTAANFGHV